MPEKVAFYVDGFNLYYAVAELEKPHLKWLNLWSLCASLIPQKTEVLDKVLFCTAYKKHDFDKLTRHQKYVRALEFTGVKCVFGHPINEVMECFHCNNVWTIQREKETDVNIALHLIVDAMDGAFNHAYLITADLDQAATARIFADRCPNLKFTTVAPPGRNFSTHILKHTDRKIALTEDMIARHLFPKYVFEGETPKWVRPPQYDPPKDWKAPT